MIPVHVAEVAAAAEVPQFPSMFSKGPLKINSGMPLNSGRAQGAF
jgi:hypothetical protein